MTDQNENPQDGFPPRPPKPGFGQKLKKAPGPVGVGIIALFAKFKFALVFVLKYGWVILKTGGSMILYIGVYALFFGFWWAFGFALLIFVHECGHLLAAKRFGLKVSAPMFIPFIGAVILLKESPQNAWVESVIGIAGPILGSLGALVCEVIYLATGNLFFRGLAYSGFFINLFNLMPFGFLDGGRIVTAISRWLWLVGAVGMVFMMIYQFNFILLLIVAGSLPRLFSLFRPKTDEERRYYEVTPRQRLLMGLLYFGLIAALVLGMRLTLISHELLHRRRDQVVISMTDDFHARELSRHRFPAQIDAAIDVRRVGLAARHPVSSRSANGVALPSVGGADQSMFPRSDLRRVQILRPSLTLDQDHGLAADARG